MQPNKQPWVLVYLPSKFIRILGDLRFKQPLE